MGDINSRPTKNIPPAFESEDDKWPWLEETLKIFLDAYAFSGWSGKETEEMEIDAVDKVEYVDIMLSNGGIYRIPVGTKREVIAKKPAPDSLFDYASLTLELGVTFVYLIQSCHSPDRDKFLLLMKFIMLQMKANNSKAKYPLEILRFLVQQYSLLGENEAQQMFLAHFVNTKGHVDSFMPADHMMEWVVRANKHQIKHMFAGKTPANVSKKSKAMPGIAEVSETFDKESNAVKHSGGHTTRSAREDELKMIDDILEINPFNYTAGRKFGTMKHTIRSMKERFDGHKIAAWFQQKKPTFRP